MTSWNRKTALLLGIACATLPVAAEPVLDWKYRNRRQLVPLYPEKDHEVHRLSVSIHHVPVRLRRSPDSPALRLMLADLNHPKVHRDHDGQDDCKFDRNRTLRLHAEATV